MEQAIIYMLKKSQRFQLYTELQTFHPHGPHHIIGCAMTLFPAPALTMNEGLSASCFLIIHLDNCLVEDSHQFYFQQYMVTIVTDQSCVPVVRKRF